MKPKNHTNYIRFPKKLRRMKKHVSKSRRGTNMFGDYRGVYIAARWMLRFYKKYQDALRMEKNK